MPEYVKLITIENLFEVRNHYKMKAGSISIILKGSTPGAISAKQNWTLLMYESSKSLYYDGNVVYLPSKHFKVTTTQKLVISYTEYFTSYTNLPATVVNDPFGTFISYTD